MSWEPIAAILFVMLVGGIWLWPNVESKRAHARMEEKRRKKK